MAQEQLKLPLADAVAAIVARLPSDRRRIIAIDGPAGAGKSTLADALGQTLVSCILHMDDLYDGWHNSLGEELAGRLQREVLTPWAAGEEVTYRRYDWTHGGFGDFVTLPTAPTLIMEGVGAAQSVVRKVATLTVFVEVDADTGLERVSHRDGAQVAAHMPDWQKQEQAHFERERTRTEADLLLSLL